jgi:hypothetical protein
VRRFTKGRSSNSAMDSLFALEDRYAVVGENLTRGINHSTKQNPIHDFKTVVELEE